MRAPMVLRSISIFAAVLAITSAACRPTEAQVRSPATGDDDIRVAVEGEISRVWSIALVSAGPVVVGTAAGPLRIAGRAVEADARGGDGYVAGFDWKGGLRWIQRLPSNAHVISDGLLRLPDDSVLLVGSFERSLWLADRELSGVGKRDCFVARLDATGAVISAYAWGSSEETLCRGVTIIDDSAWIVASFSGTLRLGTREHVSRGILDVVVAEVGLGDGALRSSFSFGTPAEDVGRGILATENDLIVVGSYGSPWGPLGDAGVAPDHRALELTPALRLAALGDADGFVARLDRTGEPRWAVRQAGPGFDVVKQVTALRDGFAISVCSQQGAPPPGVSGLASDVPLGGWVTHLGPDGTERWRWSDPAVVTPSAIVTSARGVVFSGHYRDGLVVGAERWAARGPSDAMWIELDVHGHLLRGGHCGSPGTDNAYAVAVDNSQRVYFGGVVDVGSTCTPNVSGGFLLSAARP